MVRTRGGGSSNLDLVRSTASVRRKRGGPSTSILNEQFEDYIEQKEVEVDDEGYPGGPLDKSLLVNYEHHVARQLWNGLDRGELKVVSHGRKINKLGEPHERIQAAVELSGLGGLLHASYESLDRGLLCAFVERWHAETNSFHLSVGEMTITFDDVSNLLHLPIVGQFYTQETLDSDSANDLLVESLRVDRALASEETRHCRGAHVRLSWLRDVYGDACSRRQWTVAARAYLLHLVGCTIFADKSVTSVSVFYLGFFVDLRLTGGYSWAAAALTHMYEQLGDRSYANTKQLAGYATLLLYDAGKGTSIVVVRSQLDTLTSASIRLGNWTQLHMPERVLCQYGYTQIIPCNPSVLGHGHPDTNEIDRRWLHFNDYVINDYAIAPHPDACIQEYMAWFRAVLHPYVINTDEDDRPVPVPSDARDHETVPSHPEESHPALGICRRITETLQPLLDHGDVVEGSPVWEGIQAAIMLARGATDERVVYVRRHARRND
ncbi:protein MAINTENANCE OF MERISTEMS-like [Phaseolus vulgaris]|uniref:protein MAINTENANCE OF MERISTEMS-like n=1 Tax=Phaseolus vulgaris TaxID=3885 RepID=UPI0035CA7D7E